MKKYGILLIFLLFASILSLPAQEKSPAIHFESLEKDFGRIPEGEVLTHVFRFSNRGSATLEILEIAPS